MSRWVEAPLVAGLEHCNLSRGHFSPDGEHVLCFPQTDVFIAMELMGTCAEKLKKRIQGPIPERILGKMTVAVSEGRKTLLRCCSVSGSR